jgi:deazaflavin-dependent oxidoreductase (nitroreductase family)
VTDIDVRAPRTGASTATWSAACALAEAIGLGAAAGAARLGEGRPTGVALALVVAGGLVEGTALGTLQAVVLGRGFPRLRRLRYAVATVLVAGLGWAAASAPGVLGGADEDAMPALGLVLLGAAALGLAMGAGLGAAQAWALRGAVPHPWRWIGANAAAWPVAMTLIFVGATTPGPAWPAWSVVLLGAATGAVAGTALGLVTGWFLPALDGPPASGRMVLAALRTHRFRGLHASVVGLEVAGRRSGRTYRFPVQYAVAPGGLAVVPANPQTKTWWRNLTTRPTPVALLREGVWAPATARLLAPDDPAYAEVSAAYRARWPQTPVHPAQPIVLVRIGAAGPARATS